MLSRVRACSVDWCPMDRFLVPAASNAEAELKRQKRPLLQTNKSKRKALKHAERELVRA